MKTINRRKAASSASALVITLIIVVITSMLLGSYLALVQYQTAAVSRSQAWNGIIPVTEAGLEEGMAMINGTGAMIDPSGSSWGNVDGWSAMSNGITTVQRYLDGTNSSYTVSVKQGLNGEGPMISSVGYTTIQGSPWVFGSGGFGFLSSPRFSPFFLAAAGVSSGTSSASTMARKVQIQTSLMPLFAVGIACRSNFNMNGKGCTVDSFDSSNPTYSTATTGTLSNSVIYMYNSSKAKSGGDVGVNAAVSGSVSLGNGTINGKLHTGPGSVETQVQMGPHGTVGDINWAKNNSGIEGDKTPASWWQPDFNVTFPDVKEPTFSGLPLPSTSNGYVVLNGGNYTEPTGNGTGNLLIVSPTTLWLQKGGSIAVTMANTNASLTIYVGRATGTGDSISFAGQNTVNQPGYARNLMIYGLRSCTSMSLHGNAGWTACVYAPEADVTGGGGGNNDQDTQGSIVCNTMSLKGHWTFHYDESLKTMGPSRGWVAKNWTELPPPTK